MLTPMNLEDVTIGLSTDAKPANAANGKCVIEMDSSKICFYDAENNQWLEWGAEA